MKKVLAIGIGLFSYLILNMQLDISKADQYNFAINAKKLISNRKTNTINLKEEKSICNNIGHDADIENQYFFMKPHLPFVLGVGMMDIYGQ